MPTLGVGSGTACPPSPSATRRRRRRRGTSASKSGRRSTRPMCRGGRTPERPPRSSGARVITPAVALTTLLETRTSTSFSSARRGRPARTRRFPCLLRGLCQPGRLGSPSPIPFFRGLWWRVTPNCLHVHPPGHVVGFRVQLSAWRPSGGLRGLPTP